MRPYILLLPLLLAACASARVTRPEPLRVTANHYESMTGVTLTSDADVATTCRRDMITGSHIVRWYCTFADDSNQYQLARRVVLDIR
jgi:hypothetical protein